MKLHLECERTIHFQKVDGTQGVLKEGAQAYMHSVSYTHLDVYKRQEIILIRPHRHMKNWLVICLECTQDELTDSIG